MKKTKRIILIGGGGHCRACIDVVEATQDFEIVGIIDLAENVGDNVSGYPIIGTDKDIEHFKSITDFFLITIGQIKTPEKRLLLYNKVLSAGGCFPSIISPYAYVSRNSVVGMGSIVMHHATINANVSIGNNCIINTKAIVEHDSRIGNHTHLSTSSVVNGGSSVGERCFLGSGCVLKDGISIGNNVVIGASSFIRESITESGVYISPPLVKLQ